MTVTKTLYMSIFWSATCLVTVKMWCKLWSVISLSHPIWFPTKDLLYSMTNTGFLICWYQNSIRIYRLMISLFTLWYCYTQVKNMITSSTTLFLLLLQFLICQATFWQTLRFFMLIFQNCPIVCMLGQTLEASYSLFISFLFALACLSEEEHKLSCFFTTNTLLK